MSNATPIIGSQFDLYQRAASALGISDYSNRIIHYTSLDTLGQILASNELWFGNLCDLNDTAEGNHFLDAVLEGAPSLIIGKDIPGLEAIMPTFGQAVRTQTYTSSWCEYYEVEPEGRLSMWRAYAQGGAGVGLVVDSSQIQHSAMTPAKIGFHVMTAKVEYVRRDRAVDLANDLFRKLGNVEILRRSLDEKMSMAFMLAAKAPCVKHQGFSEEAEIRFLYLRGLLGMMGRALPPEQLRQAAGREFFALPLVEYPNADLDLRIESLLKKVIIGPAADKAARAAAVRKMLDAYGLRRVAVELSDIPLAA